MKTVQTVSYSLSERVAQLVAEFAERNHISKSAAAAVLLTEGAAILSRGDQPKEV